MVLPFRNAADTLPECLDSLAAQSLPTFEVLAIDDGSSDQSPEIVRSRAALDKRFRLVQPGQIGLVSALNLGLRHAAHSLIARMDADDIMHPQRLSAQSRFLCENPRIALVGCQVELFPEEAVAAGYREYVRWQNDCLTPLDIANNIFVESPLAHPSVLFRRDVVLKLGGYRQGAFPEDYELWLRMNAAGLPLAKVPQVLLAWRDRSDRTSRHDSRYDRAAFDRLRSWYLARDARIILASSGKRPLVIWGAGRKTRQRVRLLFEQGIAATAWVDVNPRKIGRTIWNLPVYGPAWLQQAAATPNGVNQCRPFVLIYVTNHGARDEIAAQLQAWGYQAGEDYLAVG